MNDHFMETAESVHADAEQRTVKALGNSILSGTEHDAAFERSVRHYVAHLRNGVKFRPPVRAGNSKALDEARHRLGMGE